MTTNFTRFATCISFIDRYINKYAVLKRELKHKSMNIGLLDSQ